jgi:hypothetical protein
VKRTAVQAGAAGALLTAALVAALVVRPGAWELAVDAWLLALGGVALAAAVGATRTASPAAAWSPFDPGRREREEPDAGLPELARIEREVGLGTATAFDVHYRLRPRLREVAEHRLATRRGLTLDSGSPAVRETLGEGLWELVRPDRERPPHHLGRGKSLAEIRAAIEALERI